MDNLSFKANLNTDVSVKPAKSQALLFTQAILAAICFFIGFYFLWHKPELSWVPISSGFVLIYFVNHGWSHSQKDIDLDNAIPTHIKDEHGNQLTIDSRIFGLPQVIQNIEKVFVALSHRHPLPQPDGIVDDSGTPLLNSKSDAIKRVTKINDSMQKSVDQIISALYLVTEKQKQEKPLIVEPRSDATITAVKGENLITP